MLASNPSLRSSILLPGGNTGAAGRWQERVQQEGASLFPDDLKYACYATGSAAARNFTAWSWWPGFHPACEEGSRDGQGGLDPGRVMLRASGRCCYGWSDLLYLPRASQRAFASLAKGAFGQTNAHEGAIPTIALALANAGVVLAVRALGCAGGCCAGPGWAGVQAGGRPLCSHPMDLRDEAGWQRAVEMDWGTW